ncbi:MAG: ABC transporter ATP-binding protein [Anaerolineae bacterium]
MLALSFPNLDRLQTGPLLTRLTSDISQVAQFILSTMRMFVRAPLLIAGSVILMFVTNWQVALFVLALVPAVALVLAYYTNRAQPRFMQVQNKLDRLNTVLQENLAGVRVVKAFARARLENERFAAANLELTGQTIGVGRMLAVLLPSLRFLVNLGLVAVVWFGGSQVIRGTLSVGQIIALNNYIFWLTFPLINLGMSVGFVSATSASVQRIAEVLDTHPAISDSLAAAKLSQAQGRVAFEGVSFAYGGEGEEAVLKGIDLVAEPGQVVAFLGATGAGKSTFIGLIPRFYDVTDGRVTIDGIDVRDLTLDSLRAQVGVVLQETVLFTGTIRDNIRYGRPDATEEQVVAAAKAAQAHDFIMALPQGYDTLVGQRGVNLSGGQRQRLAIARALLIEPRVLVMDDSTSSVDLETEGKIRAALRPLMAGRTTFIVAQRISSVVSADKIVALDRGQVAASGTHTQLLATSPIYQEIYQSQLGNGGGDSGHE